MIDRILSAIESFAKSFVFVEKLCIRWELFECAMEEKDCERLEKYLRSVCVSEESIAKLSNPIRRNVEKYRASLIERWNIINPQKPLNQRSVSYENRNDSVEVSN
jgi:hypothetical protein